MEIVTDFIFLGSKITMDSDYSHEIKRRLLLVRKAMTNLDSVLKSRDITLPTKFCIVKVKKVKSVKKLKRLKNPPANVVDTGWIHAMEQLNLCMANMKPVL